MHRLCTVVNILHNFSQLSEHKYAYVSGDEIVYTMDIIIWIENAAWFSYGASRGTSQLSSLPARTIVYPNWEAGLPMGALPYAVTTHTSL